jgi:hypothetical protein
VEVNTSCNYHNINKNMIASAEVDDFSSRFDQDFAFMEEQSGSSVSPTLWYIDSGASRHMSSVRE